MIVFQYFNFFRAQDYQVVSLDAGHLQDFSQTMSANWEPNFHSTQIKNDKQIKRSCP